MNTSLDTFDHKILASLQRDARIPLDSLADIIGLSRNACWRRVKRMEQDGVIKRQVALVDAAAVGLPLSVFVLIRTNNHEDGWLQRFERAVNDLPEIIGAHRMSGDLDYILRVQIADVAAYDAFYRRLIKRVPLSDISASFVMENIKDTTALPVG